MADWWDADGGRHRKQFKTASAAREHEHRETALAHAERASREMKLAARSGSSRRSPSPRREESPIQPAKGKLGVMIPGMGRSPQRLLPEWRRSARGWRSRLVR